MLKTVLPQRNEPGLDDVPQDVKEEMKFILADQVDQIFRAALAEGGEGAGTSTGEEGRGDAYQTEG